jgi:hypothetical protein
VSFGIKSSGSTLDAIARYNLIPKMPVKIGPHQILLNPTNAPSTTQSFSVFAFVPNINPTVDKNLEFSIVDQHVTATRHVPGPLPLLGAAAAFSYSRKLRRSLKPKVGDVSSQQQQLSLTTLKFLE